MKLFTAASMLAFPLLAQEPSRVDDDIAAQIPQKETGDEYDHFTGDWIGIRPILVDLGIHLQAGYAGEVFGNVSGGANQGAVYDGLFELALEIDTDRMGVWDGGLFRVSSLFPHGRSLSEHYTGDLLTVSNIDAYDSFRLYELWFQQSFWHDRFSLRFGQITADDEFAVTESGAHFVNSAFGWPAFFSANIPNGGAAFYAAALGARLRYEPSDSFFAQLGVFDGDPMDSREGDPRVNGSGTRFHLNEGQGMFALLELGYRPSWPLPGEYRAGAWIHTADFPSNFRDVDGDPWITTGRDPETLHQNYGFYVTADQMIWREAEEQGIALFARGGVSPRDRSLFEFVLDGGMAWRGMLPARDDDVFGIGAAHARISNDITRTERLDTAVYPQGFSDHETVLECFYTVQLAEWWHLQPDVQYIVNPGGGREASDAWVIGLRTSIVF